MPGLVPNDMGMDALGQFGAGGVGNRDPGKRMNLPYG